MLNSKTYFERTFSLPTAIALQTWANNNLIIESDGDYAMKIAYNAPGEMFAETTLSGLTIGNEYTLKLDTKEIVSNTFKIYVTASANDHTVPVVEAGYGLGIRSAVFIATAETMYLSVGDLGSAPSTYSIIDNVSVKGDGGINYVTNGTFEGNDTTGWTAYNSVPSAYSYVVEPPVQGDNPYLEDVSIPVYDSGNSKHCIIPDDEPWSSTTLNSTSYTNFFVRPGSYSLVTITRSGTDIARRTLSLYNGNDTHPGKLDLSELALWGGTMDGASFWTFDRHAYANGVAQDHRNFLLTGGATDNIFNRSYSYRVPAMYDIWDKCHRNTFQLGRHEYPGGEPGAGDGPVCIQIRAWDTMDLQCHDTKIISNEFRNQNDSFQHVRGPIEDESDYQAANGEGTILYDNDFYIENQPAMENAFDIKFGSDNPSKPVLIQNNRMWGYKKSPDYEYDPEQPYGPCRTVLGGHQSPRNVHIYDNIIFDSNTGVDFAIGFNGVGYDEGGIDCIVERNLLYGCGDGGAETGRYPMAMVGGDNIKYENNIMIDCLNAWGRGYANDSECFFGNNDICNTPDVFVQDHPEFPNSAEFTASLETNVHYATAADGGYTEDFVFTYDKYTTNPKVMTLTNAVKPS